MILEKTVNCVVAIKSFTAALEETIREIETDRTQKATIYHCPLSLAYKSLRDFDYRMLQEGWVVDSFRSEWEKGGQRIELVHYRKSGDLTILKK